MKITMTKTAAGMEPTKLKMSQQEWQQIGRQAGWLKKAGMDTLPADQRLQRSKPTGGPLQRQGPVPEADEPMQLQEERQIALPRGPHADTSSFKNPKLKPEYLNSPQGEEGIAEQHGTKANSANATGHADSVDQSFNPMEAGASALEVLTDARNFLQSGTTYRNGRQVNTNPAEILDKVKWQIRVVEDSFKRFDRESAGIKDPAQVKQMAGKAARIRQQLDQLKQVETQLRLKTPRPTNPALRT